MRIEEEVFACHRIIPSSLSQAKRIYHRFYA